MNMDGGFKIQQNIVMDRVLETWVFRVFLEMQWRNGALLAEMKSTSNNYPKRTIKARGSSETKKYLGHLWEGPSSKVFVKIFVCLFTY